MIAEKLRHWRKSHGLTQGALAEKLNVTAATVSRWEKGLMSPDPSHIRKLENIFQDAPLPDSALLQANADQQLHATKHTASPLHTASTIESGQSLTPIYLCRLEKDRKYSLYKSTIIEQVETPAPLKNVRDAFGIYMPSNEMDPTFQSGDLLFVHPTKPTNIGDDLLLLIKETGRAQPSLYIRRLEEQTADFLKVRQWSPYQDSTFDQNNIVQSYKIVARYCS